MTEEVVNLGGKRCLACYPNGFSEDRQYPAILFLHGVGAVKHDISFLQENAITTYFREVDMPFVLFEPHCEENTWFHDMEQLIFFVRQLQSIPYVDNDRLYLTGNSMGAYAAWMLAMIMRNTFAALVPVCGGGMPWCADYYIDLPIWAFHGVLDETVPVEESIKMISAVNSAGGSCKLTLYEKVAHNCWDYAYKEPSLYEWLLSISRIGH